MVKKSMLLTVLVAFSLITLASPPMRQHRGMIINPEVRGAMKTLMFFKVVKNSREKLNLTEKQNVRLDKILREVEDFTQKIKKERKKDNFSEQFIDDSFDPFKIEEEKQRKREEIKNFYLSKIKAIHDLLTKEQRQMLVNIIKEKKENMRKLKRKREIRKWRDKRRRIPKHVPGNY